MKKKSKDLAIVLVSGGMDSLLTVAMANEQHENLAMLHLNYGQRTEKKELQSFNAIARFYKVKPKFKKVIDVTFLKEIGGNSLTDKKMKVKNFSHSNTKKEIPNSYVPFRNTHLIAMAVSWAEVIGATKIYIGAVYEDSSGYPDCRPSYYQAYNQLIKEGTKSQNIEIITPVINLKKEEIVQKSVDLNAPLHLSWSCYKSQGKACGVCDSCALRLKGFQKAKISDPIKYEKIPNYNN